MATAENETTSRRPVLPVRQQRRIGIDFRHQELKLVQLSYSSFPKSGSIPILSEGQTWIEAIKEKSFGKRLIENAEVVQSFNGSRAACLLPIEMTEYHHFELPEGDTAELQSMIQLELSNALNSPVDSFTYDYWIDQYNDAEKETIGVSVVSIDVAIVQSLVKQFLSVGLFCEVLESRKTLTTRLASPEEESPALILDWGYEHVSLFLIHQQEPIYSRELKNCGLNRILGELTQSFELPVHNGHALLNFVSRAAASTPGQQSRLSAACQEIIRPILEQTLVQLRKTIQFASHQFMLPPPSSLLLIGEGAEIPGIQQELASELNCRIPTSDVDQKKRLPSQYLLAESLSQLEGLG